MKITKNRLTSGIILGLSALLCSLPSLAASYKWTDDKNNVHYSNTQPTTKNVTGTDEPVPGPQIRKTTPPAPAGQKLLFLLIGQSNMQGVNRGPRTAADNYDPRIFQYSRGLTQCDINSLPIYYWPFQAGDWIPALDPLQHLMIYYPDTISSGLTFAKTVLASSGPNDQVYLLPAALGGTGFTPMNVAYDFTWDVAIPARYGLRNLGLEAIADLTKVLANNPGMTFAGILWLQGENDYEIMNQQQYTAALTRLINAIRAQSQKSTGDQNIPFIACTMMQSWRNMAPNPSYPGVDAAIRNLKNVVWLTDFVNTDGIVNNLSVDIMVNPTDIPTVHYSASSQRQIGKLFAAAYFRVKAIKDAAVAAENKAG